MSTPGALLATLLLILPMVLQAQTQLVVYELPACGPCKLFDQQVGSIYARTTEGRRAPLRRERYDAAPPADLAHLARPHSAPTFVLVADGREIERFSGYRDDESFWMNLTTALGHLPP